jgi:hypothetical protein
VVEVHRFGFVIRIIYAACLAGATLNHIRAIVRHGWLPGHVPTASAAYWSSLTFLDPLAVFLLFWRPRAGIALTVAIIVSDVLHNLWFTATYSPTGSLYRDVMSSPMLLSQIAFFLFVAASAPAAWRGASKQAGEPLPR